MKRVNVISMGCSKNLVDSERLLRRLSDGAIETVHDDEPEAPADAVVINTCGFIGDAKEESIDMILRACEAKRDGAVGAVYVMGCLSERYAADLPAEIPEVDGWYGKFDFEDLAARLCRQPAPARTWERRLTTPPWSAYLKIAEGCNRFCAFCAIPLITGRYKSRPVEEILDEVTTLAAEGVVEFNVIAQDLSFYGRDLYGEPAIARLVDAMAAVPGVRWIRLHYAYPSDFPYDLLPVMARHANVCKYLDIALQHSADGVLDRMRRHISGDEQRALLARIRREVPGIHIRTTLMTGFPGETDEDFDELLRFVRTERFERMGAFAYCEEDDTYALCRRRARGGKATTPRPPHGRAGGNCAGAQRSQDRHAYDGARGRRRRRGVLPRTQRIRLAGSRPRGADCPRVLRRASRARYILRGGNHRCATLRTDCQSSLNDAVAA